MTSEYYKNNEIPLGDKGIPGERDDMIKGGIESKRYQYEHIQRYKYAAKRCNGMVLDVGCGTGYGTKILYEAGNEVYGIDNSQKAINYAKRNYPGPKYICCSAEKLQFEEGYFDAVTVFEIIEHVQNPEKVLDELYRVLKKDGDLFISTPNLRHLGIILQHFLLGKSYPKKLNKNNIYHIKEFSYDEFLDLLKRKRFRVISQYGQLLPLITKRVLVLLEQSPPLYKIPIFLGYLFPKYAFTVVVHAKK